MIDMRDTKAKKYDAVVSGLRDEPCAFKRQCFRDGWDAAIAALPDMVRPLQWESDEGTYFTDFGNGRPDYNYDLSTRNHDEPIIVYLGQDEISTDDCWTEEEARAVAQAHFAAEAVSAFGVQGGQA